MPEITKDDVAYVAKLAHLDLDEPTKARMREDMASILGYVEKLNELDTAKVEPMMHVLDIQNVFREDASRTWLSRDDALRNAPDTDGEYFLVPRILDQD